MLLQGWGVVSALWQDSLFRFVTSSCLFLCFLGSAVHPSLRQLALYSYFSVEHIWGVFPPLTSSPHRMMACPLPYLAWLHLECFLQSPSS